MHIKNFYARSVLGVQHPLTTICRPSTRAFRSKVHIVGTRNTPKDQSPPNQQTTANDNFGDPKWSSMSGDDWEDELASSSEAAVKSDRGFYHEDPLMENLQNQTVEKIIHKQYTETIIVEEEPNDK